VNKLRHLLRSKRGTSFPFIVAVTLSLILCFCGAAEYLRLLIIAQGVRDAVQDAVTAAVVGNYDDVYHGVREGYSGGYQPLSGDFEESLDYGDIYGQIDRILGLEQSGMYHVKLTSDGQSQFRIWGLSARITNAPLAVADRAGQRFVSDAAIELEVPLSFGAAALPPMRVTVRTSAGYIPKF
jgi:hypothetical protein